ncbi:MAG: ABC transporter ATP-binding protein/permease [Defluviitaleaceae bacterium]|nr:ABC transporter ATP-binding protein/permease [Defluviitaleaceae bacterium]
MPAFRWGLPYLSKYKWRLIFAITVSFTNILIGLINPFIAGLIVQNVIQGGQHELLYGYLGIMVGLTLYRSVSRYGFQMIFESTSQRILFELRRDVYQKLHNQNFAWFDKNRVGDIMSRMTGDLDAIRHFTAFTLYTLPENMLLFIAAIIVMAFISPILTVALVLTTPVVVYAAYNQYREMRPAFRQVREQFSNLNSICGENIGGNRVVKAFTKEAHEIEKFNEVNQAFYNSNLAAARVRIKYFPVMETCAALMPWILLLVGGLLVIYERLELWEMIMFNGYLWMLNMPTRMFAMGANDLQNAATSLDKVYDMMSQEIRVKDPAKPVEVAKVEGSVEFRDVSFKYESYESGSPQTLKNISFKAEAGQTIGIVGGTGAGKTTLTALISRFYDTSKGEVLVDGVNVKEYSLQSLRSGISYAMQDVFLYSDTVEGNVAFGVPDAPMDVVYDAAGIADAHNFISEMAEGYDTVVGERGVGLSGGQKQRISLARAVATNPAILVLDDVTSAVDMETEQRIQEALKDKVIKSGEKRTTFIVAHRLSSVKEADLILVMDSGQIIERGNHDSLLAQGGYYANMYAEQQGVQRGA